MHAQVSQTEALSLIAQQFVGLPLLLIHGLQSLSWQEPRPVAGAASANAMPDLHVSSGCSNCLVHLCIYNDCHNNIHA